MNPPTTSKMSLLTLLQTDMNIPLSNESIHPILTSPPFLSLPSSLNLRDLGHLSSSPIPHDLIYRSGTIQTIPSSALQTLGIRLILDLRTAREVIANPTPTTPGVRTVHLPPTRPPTPLQMDKFITNGGVDAYIAMYREILDIYAPSINVALSWLRDEKSPILFHCTAGKDRTGVLAALLLALAGASKEIIELDYMLTRVGIEPGREMLVGSLGGWNKAWGAGTVGMSEFVQVKGEFVSGFLENVEGEWGSVEGWVREVLGWSEDEVGVLKDVLRGEIIMRLEGETA